MTPIPTTARSALWTIPNQLTIGRLALSFVLFALIAYQLWLVSLIVFCVAAFSDWLDGYLARTYNMGSDLGRILDPLVDKVLNCGIFIALLPIGAEQQWLQPWMVTVVVARELIISGLRSYIESQGARFGADWLGKLKMALQCVAIIAIFVALLSPTEPTLSAIRAGLISAMVIVTMLSGLQYLWRIAILLGNKST